MIVLPRDCNRKDSLMRRHLKARYLGPALIALVMIIYGAVTSVRNTRANLSEFAAVEHRRVVMIELQKCLGAMVDLETGHRGYLLTGKESFLEPYRNALAAVDDHIAKLAMLTRDNPAQQMRVGMIRESADLIMEDGESP